MKKELTAKEHKQHIESYCREKPSYEVYANALRRVLKAACAGTMPEAIIQAREKSIASFAEKCARKYQKYKDPVHQFTDLCGGRIIAQTLEQVRAVKLWVEANFEVVEKEDKGLLLSDDKFGYRDMHYIIRLCPERASRIGFEEMEIQTIGTRRAELQVRSIVQHAWADVVHDRMYKGQLRLSSEIKRTGSLLAAIMEDGDRTFEKLSIEIDTMVANYTSHASQKEVEDEIKIQEMILKSEIDQGEQVKIVLQLCRILSACGNYNRVQELLKPLVEQAGPLQDLVRVELGHAICQLHHKVPKSASFVRGQALLKAAADSCANPDLRTVPNLRQINGLHARALSRLAWSEALAGRDEAALQLHRQALAVETTNPYLLANQLIFERFWSSGQAQNLEIMRPCILQAIATCRSHVVAGTELPYAMFSAGRLCLLLGEHLQAVGWYARGLNHLFTGKSCVPLSVLDEESKWLEMSRHGREAREGQIWIPELINLARKFHGKPDSSKQAPTDFKDPTPGPVLIIAGGATSITQKVLNLVREPLKQALQQSTGKVISGGTASGIPGLVGGITLELKKAGLQRYHLVGYIPSSLPVEEEKHPGYNELVKDETDRDFSPGQIIKIWQDLRVQGKKPSEVLLIGVGGGPIAAVEYHVALALGASVAIIAETGGSADAIIADPVWNSVPSLLVIPPDKDSIQALTSVPTLEFSQEALEKMAIQFHERYLEDYAERFPENLRRWNKLPDTYKTANLEQARYAVEILRCNGFDVRPWQGSPDAIHDLSGKAHETDVLNMSRLEHGRWVIERSRNQWRPGKLRDNDRKIHNCLVGWEKLSPEFQAYDINSILAFPAILKAAGFEIFKRK